MAEVNVTPKVLNINKLTNTELRSPNVVYVGRPSQWGNMHHVGYCLKCRVFHTRDEAIKLFERDIKQQSDLLEKARKDLRGKDLVCWCAPDDCHARVWLEVANAE